MARPSRPWYRSDRSMWYTTRDGKQLPLNITDPSDEAAAWAALRAILETARPPKPPPRSVAAVVAEFLADVADRVKPRTLKGYGWYAARFVAKFGTESVESLTPKALESDARRVAWSSSTRHNYLATITTILRFAEVRLSRPLAKPPKESAGAASIIPDAVYQRLLTMVRGEWRAVIQFLWETGCRPSEASGLCGSHVDWPAGVVRLREHKTRRSGHGDRLIYLNETALAVLRGQAQKHPTGYLFVGQRKRPFSAQAFVMKFQRLSAKLGCRVCSYGMRHSFASRALASGESDAIVATLMGHAGTNMIWKHYAHLGEHARQLKAASARIGRAG